MEHTVGRTGVRVSRRAVFPYSPSAAGLLSGKYGARDRPAHGRIAQWPMYKTRYGDEDRFALADRSRALAAVRLESGRWSHVGAGAQRGT